MGLELANNIDNTSDLEITTRTNGKTIFMASVTEDETDRLVGQLKNNSAPGSDGLQSYMSKHIRKYLLKPFTYIINLF